MTNNAKLLVLLRKYNIHTCNHHKIISVTQSYMTTYSVENEMFDKNFFNDSQTTTDYNIHLHTGKRKMRLLMR